MNVYPQNGETAKKTYRVGFLVMPQFSMIALSCVMDPLREANWVGGRALYDWVLITPEGPLVHASNGTGLIADAGLDAAMECDMLIVCASFDLERYSTSEVLSTLRKLVRHGVILGSIDTGSYILAKAGLLNNCHATIHWENADSFSEQFPQVKLTNEIFTIDGNCWTCSGGSSGIDMMLHLIHQQHGPEISGGVAECAILSGARGGHTQQRMSLRNRLNITDPSLNAAIQVMEANCADRLSVPDIAIQTGISQRQLERVFHKYLGTTPVAYYAHLRLERARALLKQTSLQINTIAASCGYTSSAQFSRLYKNAFGMQPSKDRTPLEADFRIRSTP